MHKQLLIVMLICLKGADYISAQQWTKRIQSGSRTSCPVKKSWN